jgi:hypothetical protein
MVVAEFLIDSKGFFPTLLCGAICTHNVAVRADPHQNVGGYGWLAQLTAERSSVC